MVLGPGGRYPREVQAGPPRPGDDPRVPREQTFVVRILSFSVRPSRLVLSARSAGMSAGSAASVIGWLVLPSRAITSCIDRMAAIRASDGEFGKAVGILHFANPRSAKQSDFIERNTCSIVHRIRYQATIWRACSSVVTVCVVNNR